jgi:opacity protein-like surface antigen
MRHFLLASIAAATLAFGAAGAMAQPTPVPNASGSQVTSPGTYRATAYQNRARQPTMKKRMMSNGRRAVPVSNASGSQVTSPETYGATAYQRRRR